MSNTQICELARRIVEQLVACDSASEETVQVYLDSISRLLHPLFAQLEAAEARNNEWNNKFIRVSDSLQSALIRCVALEGKASRTVKAEAELDVLKSKYDSDVKLIESQYFDLVKIATRYRDEVDVLRGSRRTSN